MIKVSIARQVHFLDKHADFDMYGSAISDFTHDCKISVHPTEDAAIKTTLLYNPAMVYPSTAARYSFFTDVGGYVVSYKPAYSPTEDYALWPEKLKEKQR